MRNAQISTTAATNTPIPLLNARGVAERLRLSETRARQLIRDGVLPITAILNGAGKLVAVDAVEAEKRRRDEKRVPQQVDGGRSLDVGEG